MYTVTYLWKPSRKSHAMSLFMWHMPGDTTESVATSSLRLLINLHVPVCIAVPVSEFTTLRSWMAS